MLVSLLTRKRFIFHMLFTKQKKDLRVTFRWLEQAPSRRVRVTSFGNLCYAIFSVARCYCIGVYIQMSVVAHGPLVLFGIFGIWGQQRHIWARIV